MSKLTVSSENGRILSLLSLLTLASSLEDQNRSKSQGISKGSFVFGIAFDSSLRSKSTSKYCQC